MSTALVETIKEQIVQLTAAEQAEIEQFLLEQKRKQPPPAVPVQSERDLETAELRRRQNTEWMKANNAEFGGQYVALDYGRLVAIGRTFRQAKEAARAAGIENAFVTYLPKPDEVGFWGGWV